MNRHDRTHICLELDLRTRAHRQMSVGRKKKCHCSQSKTVGAREQAPLHNDQLFGGDPSSFLGLVVQDALKNAAVYQIFSLFIF